MDLASGAPGELREPQETGRTYSRADGSARRPDVYWGGEVGAQCVEKVVKVYIWWSIRVAGSGGQPDEVDSMSLYGGDIGMNEVMTLDRLR